MARGRMLSKSLGASRKFAATGRVVMAIEGRPAEFAQLLYQLLIPHSDDFGRQAGDAFTVKHVVFPSSPRSEDEFEAALSALEHTEMITRYQSGSRTALQILNFEQHQQGLRRRTESEFGSPDGSDTLDASEADIEALVAGALMTGDMVLSPFTIAAVDRQVRIGSLWIDIVAKTTEGVVVIIEVKRQKVTDAAIRQVLKYRDLFDAKAFAVVIGHGIASGLMIVDRGVLVVTYDDQRRFQQAQGLNVLERSITFRHVPAEENVSERELNGTQFTYGGADAPLFSKATDKKPASTWKRAIAIAHAVIETWPKNPENWGPEVKGRMLEQHMDPRERSPRGGQTFDDAVAYATEQRRDRERRRA